MGQASFQVRAPGGVSKLLVEKTKTMTKSLQRASCTNSATQHGLEPSVKILTGFDAENQSLPQKKFGGNFIPKQGNSSACGWFCFVFLPARVSDGNDYK